MGGKSSIVKYNLIFLDSTFTDKMRHLWQTVDAFQDKQRQLSMAEAIVDAHFPGERRTSFGDAETENASLALQFGHPLIADGWRPTAANYVRLGMALCDQREHILDRGLQGFLDGGEAILVSFGSLIKARMMPEAMIEMLLSAFKKLQPLRVLWKWEDEGDCI